MAARGGSRCQPTVNAGSDEPVPTLPTTRTRPFIVVRRILQPYDLLDNAFLLDLYATLLQSEWEFSPRTAQIFGSRSSERWLHVMLRNVSRTRLCSLNSSSFYDTSSHIRFVHAVCRYSRQDICEWLQAHETSPSHGGKLPNKMLVGDLHCAQNVQPKLAGYSHAAESRWVAEAAPELRAMGMTR